MPSCFLWWVAEPPPFILDMRRAARCEVLGTRALGPGELVMQVRLCLQRGQERPTVGTTKGRTQGIGKRLTKVSLIQGLDLLKSLASYLLLVFYFHSHRKVAAGIVDGGQTPTGN